MSYSLRRSKSVDYGNMSEKEKEKSVKTKYVSHPGHLTSSRLLALSRSNSGKMTQLHEFVCRILCFYAAVLKSQHVSLAFAHLEEESYANSVEEMADVMSWTWGSGKYGRLGLGNTSDVSIPTPMTCFADRRVSQIACGSYCTAFVMDDGSLYMCGKDIFGLFLSSLPSSPLPREKQAVESNFLSPVRIPFFDCIPLKRVAVGDSVCCALSEAGEIYWWGEIDKKVLVSEPKRIQLSQERVVDAACGGAHMCAITQSGRLYTWGMNDVQQCGHSRQLGEVITEPTRLHVGNNAIVERVACGFSSTTIVTTTTQQQQQQQQHVVYATGTVVGQKGLQQLASLDNLCITSISCHDAYIGAACEDGNAYLYHLADLPFLDLRANATHVSRVLEQYSVRDIVCGSEFVMIVSDEGLALSWGTCCTQLGLGEVKRKSECVGPKMVGSISARHVRSIASGARHLGAVVTSVKAQRELIGWEMLQSEKVYLRSLKILTSVYKSACKGKKKLSKLLSEASALMNIHSSIVVSLTRVMRDFDEHSSLSGVFAQVANPKLIWRYVKFDGLRRDFVKRFPNFQPKAAGVLLEHAERIRKRATSHERCKPVHLMGLLDEPFERMIQYLWVCNRLLGATPQYHADHEQLVQCQATLQSELSGYHHKHDMLCLSIERLEVDKQELVRKLGAMCATMDQLFLNKTENETDKRDLLERHERTLHQLNTIEREKIVLKERQVAAFLETKKAHIQAARCQHVEEVAVARMQAAEAECKRLTKELRIAHSSKLVKENSRLRQELRQRDETIASLKIQMAQSQEAKCLSDEQLIHLKQQERENRRLQGTIQSLSQQLNDSMARRHSPLLLLHENEQEARDTASSSLLLDESNGSVRGGSVHDLVAHVCDQLNTTHMNDFMQTLFCTYRVFITPAELLYSLQELYCDVPEHMDPPQQWARVLSALRHWMMNHPSDFVLSVSLQEQLWQFLDETVSATLSASTSGAIRRDFEKLSARNNVERSRMCSVLGRFANVDRNAPLNAKMLHMFTADEVAQQLVLMESEMFTCITSPELLMQAWTKSDKHQAAPVVTAMANHFNHISNWVVSEVLSASDAKERREVLARMIHVADKARHLGSFNTLMEIIAGLNNGAVQRLNKTWKELSKRDRHLFDDLETLMHTSGSHKALRAAIAQRVEAKKSCLPYIGMYLTDLIYLEEGSVDTLAPGIVNFAKLQGTANTLHEMLEFQKHSFDVTLIPELSQYILHCSVMSEEQAWAESKKLE